MKNQMTQLNEDKGLSLEQEYADGSIELIDPAELFEYADVIASMYGMGSSKSLTEFVKRINEEDPLILTGMLNAASARLERTYGDGKNTTSHDINYGIEEAIAKTDKSKMQNGRGKLVNFLRQMGATDDEIKEGIKKIETGKIKISENDYSWIKPETLNSPNFDFEGTLKKMSEDRKNSVKIEVSHEKYANKCKNDLKKDQERNK